MKFIGGCNWKGFFILDKEDGTQVLSEKYKDQDKAPPEDAIKTDEKSEWHAIEHKLINLITSGKELTLENLRAASIINAECGNSNRFLKEPGDEKLKEGINVGLEYLRLKTPLGSKN